MGWWALKSIKEILDACDFAAGTREGEKYTFIRAVVVLPEAIVTACCSMNVGA